MSYDEHAMTEDEMREEIEVRDREREELALPHTGELIDLNDETACGVALDDIRRMQAHMQHAARILSAAIAERATILGTRSVKLSGGRVARVSGGPAKQYDGQAIERGLRAAGMPEDRISEIVEEEVSYRVRATEAKRAAAANPEYAAVIAAATTEYVKPVSVTIEKGRS